MFGRTDYAAGYVVGGRGAFSAFDKSGALLGHTSLKRDAVELVGAERSREAWIRIAIITELEVPMFDLPKINAYGAAELEEWAELLGL